MNGMTKACRTLQVAGLALVLAATSASAATGVSSRAKSAAKSPADLAEIMKSAKPMEKQLTTAPDILSRTRIPVEGKKAAPPSVMSGNDGPADEATDAKDVHTDLGVAPLNYGSGNQNTIYHYSDYLVSTKLRKAFPYRATGFFLFKQQGSWYYCTGSLISPSILLVAGHCVHAGNNSATGWDTEGYYYPAASNLNGGGTQFTPYGFASAAGFWTWSAWFSTGSLDQGYDVGLVVLNNRGGKSAEIGSYTGWLGFCYSNCLQTYWFLSQLGYPGNYYGGNYLTEGQHLYASDTRDYVWGSGMRGGSSGGPHIANIGDLSDSATDQGQWPYRNIVFAPTSWGYISEAPKIQGGSSLTGPNNTFAFKNLFNPACSQSQSLHGSSSCTLLP